MSAENNKAAVRSFNESFNAGDLDGAVAVFAPNAVIHNSGAPDPLNVEGFKQFGGVFRTAFPDGKLTIDLDANRTEHWSGFFTVPAGVDVRKVDLSIELQILAYHEQRKAQGESA